MPAMLIAARRLHLPSPADAVVVKRVRGWPFIVEAIIFTGILLCAWGLRARYLGDVPRYTDEVNEVQAAIDIARGRMYPLVSGTKHVGALFDRCESAKDLLEAITGT